MKQEMQKDVIRLCKKRAFRVAGSLALFWDGDAMQGYADQPSMGDGLGRLASRSGKRKHKAWQGIHELGVFSV
jgi:hypothetical protein